MEKEQPIKGFRDTIEWYKENAAQYIEGYEAASSPKLLEEFVRLIKLGGTVLDAGCAAGRDSKFFFDEGLDVTGVDLVGEFIEIACEKYPNITFEQGDFLRLRFNDETFDGVWAHASLLHFETLEDVRVALSEFRRVLKPKGLLHIFVKQQMGKEKTSVVSDSLSKHDRFFRWFLKEEVNDLLLENGFDIINLEDSVEDQAGREDTKWIAAFARKI